MATPLPHEYEAALDWAGAWPALATAGPRPLIEVGPPPEFGAAVLLAEQRCFVASALRLPVQVNLAFRPAATPARVGV